jgi:hypothetical protein
MNNDFKLPKVLPMHPKREELFLKVVDDIQYLKPLGPLLHHLSEYRHVDTILGWLIVNRFVGKTLLEVWRVQFRGSLLAVAKWVIKEHNRASEIAPVIVGRDFKSRS